MEKQVEKLFFAKLATGKYDHYTEEDKKMLYLDCVMQARAMEVFNGETNGTERS